MCLAGLRHVTSSFLLLALLPAGVRGAPQSAVEPSLWGRVTLVDGETVEGFLRWDRNETTTADILAGDRDPTEEGLRLRSAFAARSAADRRRSIELPGVRVTWEEDDDVDTAVSSGVRLGRVVRIVPDGWNVVVELRDGGSVEFRPSSTDIGPTFRGLEVETRSGDVRTFEWSRLADVRFLPAPEGAAPGRARLHGTVETRDGVRFTGWIAWDADEVFESDLLEAADTTVRFGDVATIERARRGADIVLASGATVTLTGPDDVDEGDRRIHVSDPALGGAVVGWDAFDSVRFHPPEIGAVVFDGGGPLVGRLETESGELLEGRIVWDLDEAEGWQFLNGAAGGVQLDIEFSRIARIEKARGGSGAVVVLRDGRVMEVEGSNDVEESIRGIVVVAADGGERFVDWAGFHALDLGGR